jgi:hypothetical protein
MKSISIELTFQPTSGQMTIDRSELPSPNNSVNFAREDDDEVLGRVVPHSIADREGYARSGEDSDVLLVFPPKWS